MFFAFKLPFKDLTFGTKYAVWNDGNNNYTYSYIYQVITKTFIIFY